MSALPLVALVAAAQDIQLRTEDEDQPTPLADPPPGEQDPS